MRNDADRKKLVASRKRGGNRLVWLQFASSLVAEKTIHLKGEDKGKWYVHTQDMRCMWWGTL
jgi:hypothetical protein